MNASTAVVILAGGRATRLPGKLERKIGDRPMLAGLFERLRGRWPIYIAAQGGFAADLDAQLECPLIVDRVPARGPLAALVNAAGALRESRVFAIAGDLPLLRCEVLESLEAAWQPGDEAVCAQSAQRPEPLVALYDRESLVREGFALVREGAGAMHELLLRLRTRRLAVDGALLLNVNTPADFELAISSWRTQAR